MTGNVHSLKNVLVAAALAIGASGVARADDSSLNPFTGESYAAFNSGHDRLQIANPAFDKSTSAWRQSNPSGLSERVLESYSAPGEAWHLNKPVFASTPEDATFKQTHPSGLTEPDLQALSSEAPAWQLRVETGVAPIASEDQAALAQSAAKEPLRERIANFFHVTHSRSAQ